MLYFDIVMITHYAIQDTAPILVVFYNLFVGQDIDIVIYFIFTYFRSLSKFSCKAKKNIIRRLKAPACARRPEAIASPHLS